jgi:hypothetical protein
MKFHKAVVAAGLTIMLSAGPVFAQGASARSSATKEEAQSLLSIVSQQVWHAQHSSTGYGRVQEEYLEGERAYFQGDYAKAIKHLKIAHKIVKGIPNDYAND